MSVVERKAVIKSSDMPEEMQQDAILFANHISIQSNVDKAIAGHIKKEFDKKYGPTWHCIVGDNFGSYVTHEFQHFIYFILDEHCILLWRSA